MRATHADFAEELRLNLDLCANRAFSLNGPGSTEAPLPRRDGPIVFYRVRNDSDTTVQTLVVRPATTPGPGATTCWAPRCSSPSRCSPGACAAAGRAGST